MCDDACEASGPALSAALRRSSCSGTEQRRQQRRLLTAAAARETAPSAALRSRQVAVRSNLNAIGLGVISLGEICLGVICLGVISLGEIKKRSGRDQGRSGRGQSGRDQSAQQQERRPPGQDRAAWRGQSSGDNRDHSRSDAVNDVDHPFARFQDAWPLRRVDAEVRVRSWSDRAEPTMPQPCRLCNQGFPCREGWLDHIRKEHGGLQRYRNALFSMLSLQPYVVRGQEWRAEQANFTEFFAKSAMDWERFTPAMNEKLRSPAGLLPDERWAPRALQACVFCTRRQWQEDTHQVFLSGPHCFMKNPKAVAEMLAWERYRAAWPDIPAEELQASAVSLPVGVANEERSLLLHKRRVDDEQSSVGGSKRQSFARTATRLSAQRSPPCAALLWRITCGSVVGTLSSAVPICHIRCSWPWLALSRRKWSSGRRGTRGAPAVRNRPLGISCSTNPA